jgi:putative transcriptional regulator
MGFGKELIESAREALQIAEGKANPGAVYLPEAVDVAAIRKSQKLSQGEFAKRYGLSAGAVSDWEQDRRKPDRAAMVLLMVIEREPEAVERALSAA